MTKSEQGVLGQKHQSDVKVIYNGDQNLKLLTILQGDLLIIAMFERLDSHLQINLGHVNMQQSKAIMMKNVHVFDS